MDFYNLTAGMITVALALPILEKHRQSLRKAPVTLPDIHPLHIVLITKNIIFEFNFLKCSQRCLKTLKSFVLIIC